MLYFQHGIGKQKVISLNEKNCVCSSKRFGRLNCTLIMALSISKSIHLQTTFESILANLNKVFEMGFAFKIRAAQKKSFLLFLNYV
jgi:hypothetical protein